MDGIVDELGRSVERRLLADRDPNRRLVVTTSPGQSIPGEVPERVLLRPARSIPHCLDRPQSRRRNPSSHLHSSSTRGRRADRVLAHISGISSLGFQGVNSPNCRGFTPVCRTAGCGRTSPHLSTRQYARLVHRWIASIGLDDTAYGTHTMRRTKASLIYRRTKNLRAVQLLLGHTKLESTVRYLGIEVDDALEMAEQTEV